MLVLSRKCSQTIQIGDEIRITVVKIDRGQVRLGIEAPGDVSVLREELLIPASMQEIPTAACPGRDGGLSTL